MTSADPKGAGLINARPPEGLVVRVGIPERSGKLAFHAFENGYPTMVSANAFWNPQKQQLVAPTASDLHETDLALDSAGFTAMLMWKRKGKQTGMANVYPWTYTDYLCLASELNPAWYAAPDLCCESELASNQEEINYRIDATATLLEGCLRILASWYEQLCASASESVAQSMIRPPVPVIQGWSVSDYQRSLDLTLAIWHRWTPWLAPPALIGVGSVCRRDLTHPVHGLLAILSGLEHSVPSGSRLHLFGVKGEFLRVAKMMPLVASTDSMAYDYASRRNAHREGRPNSYLHRNQEMTRWMELARAKTTAASGDQFRLFQC